MCAYLKNIIFIRSLVIRLSHVIVCILAPGFRGAWAHHSAPFSTPMKLIFSHFLPVEYSVVDLDFNNFIKFCARDARGAAATTSLGSTS